MFEKMKGSLRSKLKAVELFYDYRDYQSLKNQLHMQELAEKEETERNARLMNACALQDQRDKELATQAICSHLTEKGDRASISGQRGHNGKYILLCARCSKLWTDVSEIPPHLNNLIRWDWIGGPQ